MKQEDIDQIMTALSDKLTEVKEELKEFTRQEIATRFEESTKSRKEDTISVFEATQKINQDTGQQIINVLKKLITLEVPEVNHKESLKRGETVYYLKEIDDGKGGTKRVKKRLGSVQDVLGRLSETADVLEEFLVYVENRDNQFTYENSFYRHKDGFMFAEIIKRLEKIERLVLRADGSRVAIDDYPGKKAVEKMDESIEVGKEAAKETYKPMRDLYGRLKKASMAKKRAGKKTKESRDKEREFNKGAQKKAK